MAKRSATDVVVPLPGLTPGGTVDIYAGRPKAKLLVHRTTFRAIPWSAQVEYELYYQGWTPWYGYVDINGQPMALDGSAGEWVDPRPETVQRVNDGTIIL